MPHFDEYLIEFFKYNYLTVGSVFLILRGLAAASPWTWDEKLLDVIVQALDVFTIKKKANNKNGEHTPNVG